MKIIKIHRNSDPKNQPDASSRLIINYNINFEIGSNTTEDGFDGIIEYADYTNADASISVLTKTLIGHILLPNNAVCLFSNYKTYPASVETIMTEVAILDNNTYKPILRAAINCSEKFPIEGSCKVNSKGETEIYFTDFYNPQRWLNLTNPQVTQDIVLVTTQIDRLLYFPSYTAQPVLLSSVNNGGGNLPTGSYIPFYKYADQAFNETNIINNASVISLGDGTIMGDTYDGAPANSNSGKSVTLSILTPDARYSYIHLYLVYKASTNYVVYDCGLKPILGTAFSTTIAEVDTTPIVPLETITVQRPSYSTAKTVTQLDSVLYWGNLKERPDFDFQPYVNNIVVNPVQDYTAHLDTNINSYRKEVYIYDTRGFLYDEVYAKYVSFIIEDQYGTYETKAYHVPGRQATTLTLPKHAGGTVTINETDPMGTVGGVFQSGVFYDFNVWGGGVLADTTPGGEIYKVNNSAKVFHAFPTACNPHAISAGSYMGYWENTNETYPTGDSWKIKDHTGAVIGSIEGANVRHHKFPHASVNTDGAESTYNFHNFNSDDLGTSITSAQYAQVNPIGIQLSNIIIPDQFVGKVKKINVYYAKRTSVNQTIVGQSIAIHDCDFNYSDNGGLPFPTVSHVGGNIEIANEYHLYYSGLAYETQLTKNKKFIKCSPFDMVANDAYSGVTHVNTVYEYISDYTYVNNNTGGVSSNTKDGAVMSSGPSAVLAREFRLDNKTALTLKRAQLNNYNRRVVKSNYIESVPAYPGPVNTAGRPAMESNHGIYGYPSDINHFKSDKTVLMQLDNNLDDVFTAQTTGSYNQYDGGTPISRTPDLDGTGSITSGIYLVNLHAYKTDVYTNFTAQELCLAGVSDITGGVTSSLYGGDTFSSYYGYQSCADLAGLFGMGANPDYTWSTWQLRFLHYFICQSTSNINYRNRGTSTYDSYFPYTDSKTLLTNPLLPNAEPNYYSYNPTYNTVNDIHQPITAGLIPLSTQNKFPTRVIRTAKDNTESLYDNFRVVLPNDYIDLPKDKGSIWSLKGAYNKLNIFFENTFRETMGRERILTENAESYVGAGDIFNNPPKDIITVDGGYGGTKSQWAINITPHGLFFIDINRGKVFLKTDRLEEISKQDLFYFFEEECKFNVYNSLRDQLILTTTPYVGSMTVVAGEIVTYENAFYQTKNSVGDLPTNTTNWTYLFSYEDIPFEGLDSNLVGFKSTYDSKYKRIILSKTDVTPTTTFISNFQGFLPSTGIPGSFGNIYLVDGVLKKYSAYVGGQYIYYDLSFNDEMYFTKSQWTTAYYPEYKSWSSFYLYYPESLFNTNDAVYSSFKGTLMQHNVFTLPLFYTDTPSPSTLDMHFNNEPDLMKEFKSVQFKTKANNTINGVQNQEYLTTFDDYQSYNSYQLSDKVTLTNRVTSRNLEGYWSINWFRDHFNNGTNIFNTGWSLPFNTAGVIVKHWTKLKRFVDNWFAVRVNYDNNKTESVIWSGVDGEGYTVTPLLNPDTSDIRTNSYHGLVRIANASPVLYVNDWIIITTASGDHLGRITKITPSTYWSTYNVKFRTPFSITTNVAITNIQRLKQIKLSLLETTASTVKNTRV